MVRGSVTAMRGYAPVVYTLAPSHAFIGYTSPNVTFAQMRAIQRYAESLDLQVEEWAPPTFRAAWKAWLERAWRPFYEQWAGPNAGWWTQTVTTRVDSDGLAAETESYRQQLQSFDSDYRRQRTRSGQPVPHPAGSPPPFVAPSAGERSLAFDVVPWWFWLGAIGAIGGLGYLAWRSNPLSRLL